MMYSNKLVACVVVNGKIAREIRSSEGDTVFLPFGSEYAIRIKNLDVRRAVVSVTVDGVSATGGTQIVVNGNSETDLEGILDAKANVAHNRFKFIEKTEQISEHRGDKADDGLIRVEWQFEEIVPTVTPCNPWKKSNSWEEYDPYIHRKYRSKGVKPWDDGILRGASFNSCAETEAFCSSTVPCCNSAPAENDKGITVAGSVVDQRFSTTFVNRLDPQKFVMVLQLKGKKASGSQVSKPLLVSVKVECPTCGNKNKSNNKFCPNCSTCLV